MHTDTPHFFYFDLGNVLLRFERLVACRQIGTLVGLSARRVEQLVYDSGLQARFEDGQMSSREFYQQFCDVSGSRPKYEAFCDAGSRIFELNVPVVAVVCQLKQAGYPLGILSNTCDSHWQHIAHTYRGIRHLFDVHVLSYEERSSKPDLRIYQAAIQRAGGPGRHIFFVDDRPENVQAACQAGMDAVRFESAEQLAAALRSRGVGFNY